MFLEIFKNIHPTDVIDILVVSFIIYRILCMIRGTRAFQMLLGVILMIGAFYLSEVFELHTVRWLFSNFFNAFIIVMVVLFQNEIRRALTEMGKNFFLRKAHTSAMLDDVIKAAIYMARRRIGALIVIEQETGLREYIEKSLPIDALISMELIVSIFHESSPIHDGAIILQSGRIAVARCFLPLTTEEHISRSYGTRHRAAIGLSERSDAVIVVVSEENGRISIAHGGKLTHFPDHERFETTLRSLIAEG
ncbi:MAG: TIGR00159 family protein [Deltaproteobacteria bacterium]|nr:MAG: TIGR00159 family protein [Deltaproteobacteria bacterium]